MKKSAGKSSPRTLTTAVVAGKAPITAPTTKPQRLQKSMKGYTGKKSGAC